MSAERESEPVRDVSPTPAPAEVAAPAVVANPLQGAGAGPAPTAMSPGQVLGLQRSAGNRAVSRVIARQQATPPAPPPAGTAPSASATTKAGLTRAEFVPTGGEPSSSGTVGVVADGEHAVTLNAPEVTATGKVEWTPPAAPAAPAPAPAGGAPPAAGATPERPTEVRVGWINTVLEGKREFLYTEDGTPGGKVVRSEQMRAPAGARDAMWANDPRTGKQVQHSSSEAPFYGPAKRISPGQSADLEPFKDTPGAGAAREVEGPDGKKGKLAKISGADRFRLSIGVTEVGNNETIHLTAKEWTVPWDVTLDQKGLGTGSAISFQKYMGRLEDIKRGEGFAVGEAGRFPWPQTPEEVKTMTTSELTQAIPYAEKQDAASWMLMCQELRGRNPPATVTVLVKESTALIWDDFTITIAGPRTITKSATEGLSAAPVKFQMLEILDPQDLKTGLVVTISVSVEGSTPQPMTWPWPFGPLQATRYWWDKSGASKGEWTDPKGAKRDTQTDIVVRATGFG